MCSRRVSSSHFLSVTCCATHLVKSCKSLVCYNKQMYITVLYHQKAWVFDWQHICYVCWMCRDSYGYSSRRLVPLFAWSRLHTGAYKKTKESYPDRLDESRCSERVNSSCSTCCIRRFTFVANSVINHEWWKDRIVITTNGTYPWTFVTGVL